jgi:hypothetical protein
MKYNEMGGYIVGMDKTCSKKMPEGKTPLRTPRHRQEDNIKIDLKK